MSHPADPAPEPDAYPACGHAGRTPGCVACDPSAAGSPTPREHAEMMAALSPAPEPDGGEVEPCRITADGWCATHSTEYGPEYHDGKALTLGSTCAERARAAGYVSPAEHARAVEEAVAEAERLVLATVEEHIVRQEAMRRTAQRTEEE